MNEMILQHSNRLKVSFFFLSFLEPEFNIRKVKDQIYDKSVREAYLLTHK